MIAVLLGLGSALAPRSLVFLGITVLGGQLTIGWSNDLLDAERDRASRRSDKPLATGQISSREVTLGIVVAAIISITCSLPLGAPAAAAHLILLVGSGWAYNLVLKRTAASVIPYVIAFGALPTIVTLSLPEPAIARPWLMITGALLGIGAHLVNALPDLADDLATKVSGLPQRLGAWRSRIAAAAALAAGSSVAILGSPDSTPLLAWASWLVVAALVAITLVGQGKLPFRAALAATLIVTVQLLFCNAFA